MKKRAFALGAMLQRWPAGVVRYRWPIVAAWVAVSVILVPAARKLEDRLEVAARMPGGQAQGVDNDLEQRFRSPFTNRVVLVAEGIPGLGAPGGREALEKIVEAVRPLPGVAGILSSLEKDDPIFRGRKGGFLIIVGLEAGDKPVESLLPRLRIATAELTKELRPAYPNAWLGWTGVAPLNYDLRRASGEDARSAEIRVLPFTLLLLLLAFGGVVAASLPIGVGILSIAIALGIAAGVAEHVTLSILIQSLSSMIGLGLGIDYALLTVSRFREALAEGREAQDAAEEAARHAGWTILLSAFPVSISFAALLTIPLSELRSVGFAGLTVTVVAMLLSVTLLPAILSLLGSRIDVLRLRPRRPARAAGGSEVWRRWGRRVISRPVLALAAASAPLLLLAVQARRLDTVMPEGDWLPPGSESVRAYHALQAMGRDNLIHSLRVVLHFPAGVTIESPQGWTAAATLFDRLRADGRIEQVQCLPAIVDEPGSLRALRRVPEEVRRTLTAADGSATLFEVIPSERLTPRDQVSFARDLRTWNAPEATGLPGTKIAVGGRPGFDADYEDTVARHFHRVIVPGRRLHVPRPVRRVSLAARRDQGGSPEPPFGGRRIRGARPRVPGGARRLAVRTRGADGKRLSDHSGPGVLHRLRPLDGLRGDPRRPGGRGAARRPRRVRRDHRGSRAHGDGHHERGGDHDRRLRRVRARRVSSDQDAGLRALGRRRNRRDRGAHGHRTGALAAGGPLELVAGGHLPQPTGAAASGPPYDA